MSDHANRSHQDKVTECYPKNLKPSSDSAFLFAPSRETLGVALDGPLCVLYMSKDPAVLFYTSDFLSGTLTMDNEHVGMYIRLLCLQHQKGKLTEKDMLYICKSYVEDVYLKFTKDKDGFYENPRMTQEALKRRLYSESRSKNVSKRYSTYVEHMENENEDENKDINNKKEAKKFKPPSLEELKADFKERGFPLVEADKFMAYFESVGWVVGASRKPMKSWRGAVATWCAKLRDSGIRPKEVKITSPEPITEEIQISDEDRMKLIKMALPNYGS